MFSCRQQASQLEADYYGNFDSAGNSGWSKVLNTAVFVIFPERSIVSSEALRGQFGHPVTAVAL